MKINFIYYKFYNKQFSWSFYRTCKKKYERSVKILNKNFEKVDWFRDNGIHGGGNRYEARDNVHFNTASVNVSQVHNDED